jgi:hypothetical protein
LPATSRKTTTRPYGSVRGSSRNTTAASRIRRSAASKSSTSRKNPTRPGVWAPTAALLPGPVGAGQQQSRLRTAGPDDDPPLGDAGPGQRRVVGHQLEAQDVDEETDGRVVLVDQNGDQLQAAHNTRARSAVVAVAQLAQLPAQVLQIPPQVPGGQDERGGELPALRVAGQRPAMHAEVLGRLGGRQQSRIFHVSTLGEISISITLL